RLRSRARERRRTRQGLVAFASACVSMLLQHRTARRTRDARRLGRSEGQFAVDVVPDLERPSRTGEVQTDCRQLVPRLSTRRYVKFPISAKSGIDQLIPAKIFPSLFRKY